MTTITLTAELEEIVTEKIKSGAYKSANEVIAASLRLLKVQEKGLEIIRRELMRGVEDIEQGRFSTYSTSEQLEQFSNEIIKQSLEKSQNSKE